MDIKDPEWQNYIVISAEKGRMVLEPRSPVALSI